MPDMTRPPLPAYATEHGEQVALIQRCRLAEREYPELALLFAIPNAGGYTGGYKANRGRVARALEEGVKAGVPDLCLPVPRLSPQGVVVPGLYIEMKRVGEKATPRQEWWLKELTAQGYWARVCEGQDEAWGVIMRYMTLRRPVNLEGGAD